MSRTKLVALCVLTVAVLAVTFSSAQSGYDQNAGERDPTLVGPAPAQVASERQRREDRPDHRRPRHDRQAVDRGDESSPGDLDGEDREARPEGEREQSSPSRHAREDQAAVATMSSSSITAVRPRSFAYHRRTTL